MKPIEILYEVRRDEELVITDTAVVNLTDKNIKEIAAYILEESSHQTGELVDIPANVYDRIFNQVIEDAGRKLKSVKDGVYEDDIIYLVQYLPTSLLELLPEEVLDVLPEELFGDEDDEEKDASFLLSVEDIFQIKGRGLVLDGTVEFGRCKTGDKGLLIDEEGNVICETTVTLIECERATYDNFDDFEETEGLHVGVLTPIEKRKDAKGVVTFVIPAEL